MASVAAGVAGLTVILGLCAWVVHGGEPTDASFAGPEPNSPATTAALSFDERFSLDERLSFDERFSSGRSAPLFGSVTVKTVIASLPTIATIAVPAAPAPNAA